MTLSKSELIAQQNDIFRRNFGDSKKAEQTVQGKYTVTHGIANLSPEEQISIVQKVRNFENFTENNDPYGEHNMGIFKQNAQSIYWKINYYDLNYHYGSDDPSDLNQTRRVLTIMLSHEY